MRTEGLTRKHLCLCSTNLFLAYNNKEHLYNKIIFIIRNLKEEKTLYYANVNFSCFS